MLPTVEGAHIFTKLGLMPAQPKQRDRQPGHHRSNILHQWGSMAIDEIKTFPKYEHRPLNDRMRTIRNSIRNWQYRSNSKFEFEITRGFDGVETFVEVRRIA